MSVRPPHVSIIVPAYNAAATLGAALDSALAQTYRDFELLAVDDGSTDNTAAILDRYGESIRVIRQANAGLSAARNAAMKVARGDLAAFLDADDLWLPEMLERTVAVLDSDPACVLAFTDLTLIDSRGVPLSSSLVGHGKDHAPTLDEMLHSLWPIMPSAVVMRRAVLERIGGFNEEFRSYGYEDAWCWMLAREQGEFRFIPEKLVKWRYALFPNPLKIARGYPHSVQLFSQLVRERYGVSATPLVTSRRRAARSIVGYIGLTALRDGDRRVAREAFSYALKLDRWRMKNYLRWMRTFLPPALARCLTGSTRPAA